MPTKPFGSRASLFRTRASSTQGEIECPRKISMGRSEILLDSILEPLTKSMVRLVQIRGEAKKNWVALGQVMRTWSVLSLIPWHQQDPWLMCRVWRRARRSWAQSQRKSFTLGVVWANPLPVTRLESLLRVLMSSHMVSMFAFEVTLGIRPPSFFFSFLTWTATIYTRLWGYRECGAWGVRIQCHSEEMVIGKQDMLSIESKPDQNLTYCFSLRSWWKRNSVR